jgi:hypothetical protein
MGLAESREQEAGIACEDINCQPADAYEALVALETLTERLRDHDDARAVFLDVYVVITRKVVELVRAPEGSGFHDPPWLSQLTARFAEDALVAVCQSIRREPIPSAAWRFAAHYAEHEITRAYQNAILGINAHINFDLARAVYADFEARAVKDERLRAYRHDYFKVNEILYRSVWECLDVLVERHQCRATESLLRLPGSRLLLRTIIMAILRIWRRRAWDEVLALLGARDEQAREKVVRRMDRFSGRVAQVVVARDAARYALSRGVLPFRLARAAESWPGVTSARRAQHPVRVAAAG